MVFTDPESRGDVECRRVTSRKPHFESTVSVTVSNHDDGTDDDDALDDDDDDEDDDDDTSCQAYEWPTIDATRQRDGYKASW